MARRLLFLRLQRAPHAAPPPAAPPRRSLAATGPPLRALRPWAPRIPARFDDDSSWSGDPTRARGALPDGLREELARLVPGVEAWGAEALWLDVGGLQRLRPDRRPLLREVEAALGRHGLAGRGAGEAVDPLCARLAAAVAPRGHYWSVPDRAAAAFLAPFPLLCAGRAQRPLVRELSGLGVERFGELAQLPAELVRQALGDRGLALWEAARGRASHRGPQRGDARWERHRFAQPQGDPALVASALAVLADRLASALARDGLAGGELLLWVQRAGGHEEWARRRGGPWSGRRELARQASSMWEQRGPGRVGVVACGLRATGLRPRPASAPMLALEGLGDGRDARLDRWVERIRARHGQSAVRWSTELWMHEGEGR